MRSKRTRIATGLLLVALAAGALVLWRLGQDAREGAPAAPARGLEAAGASSGLEQPADGSRREVLGSSLTDAEPGARALEVDVRLPDGTAAEEAPALLLLFATDENRLEPLLGGRACLDLERSPLRAWMSPEASPAGI